MSRAYVKRYEVISPLANSLAGTAKKIKSADIPENFLLSQSTYDDAFNESGLTRNEFDESSALAVSIIQKLNIPENEIKDIPIIIANSKGGQRYADRLMRTFHNGKLPPEGFKLYLEGSGAGVSAALIKRFNMDAPVLSVQAACASGMAVINTALSLLHSGYNRVITAAVECSMTELIENGFARMKVLSSEKRMKPFSSKRSGFKPGEGAAAMLIESSPEGGIAELEDAVLRNDASGLLRFREDGSSIADCLRSLKPLGGIDFVCAHATATGNDSVEAKALQDVYGAQLPVTGLKPYLGHQLGVNALSELIVSTALMREGLVPALPFSHPLDFSLGINVLTKPMSIMKGGRFVKTSYGFGGAIGALIMKGL